MALTFGQILSGAGAIARSTREEQSKQLQLQEQQMRLAELRRLQAEQELERQALQQGQGGYITAPLFTAGAPMQPTQIQAPQQQATQAQQQAVQQQAQAAAQEPSPPTARLGLSEGEISPPLMSSPLLGGVERRGELGGEGTLLGRLREGRAINEQLREELSRERQEIREALGPNATAQEVQAELLRRRPQLGVQQEIVSESQPTKETQAPQAPAGEQNPATVVSEQGPPQTGVTEQTQRIIANTNFYLGDPNAITPEIQNVANQRQELVRMADIYRRNGMVNKYQETITRLKEVDDSLIYLQGMRGVNELRTFNNPLRLEQALSYVTGQTIRLRPRTDGKYDYLVANPDGNFVVAQAGVSTEALANRAIFTLDRNAAVQAAQRSAELQQLAQEEEIKAGVAMRQAAFEANLPTRPEVAGLSTGEDIIIGGSPMAPTLGIIQQPTEEVRSLFGGIQQPAMGYTVAPFEQGSFVAQPYLRTADAETLENWNN